MCGCGGGCPGGRLAVVCGLSDDRGRPGTIDDVGIIDAVEGRAIEEWLSGLTDDAESIDSAQGRASEHGGVGVERGR
jgi:hypothetical protein